MLRALLLIVMALGFAGIGTVAWFSLQGPPPADPVPVASVAAPPPPPVPQTASVLVASRNLRAGALLRPEDMVGRTMPASAAPIDGRLYSREARDALQGALLRRSLREGDVILDSDVMMPGDSGYLAASLAPGMRAMPIAVDQVSGAAGLIWPGDRVDVLLTQQVSREEVSSAGHRTSGEVVARDLKVLAVDQNLVQGAIGEAGEGFRAARIVTLEVTLPQAERLAVARRLGQLSLVLRPASEGPAAQAAPAEPTVVWGSDASTALRQNQSTTGGGPATVQIFTGTRAREEIRF